MDESGKIVIARWVSRAQQDLITGRAMLHNRPPVPEAVCFHAQQCAEKMLKAFLVLADVHVEKTHDLVRLLKPCIKVDPAFRELTGAAETLSPYAVEVRYVDDWRDIPAAEAGRALELAERVMAFVRPRLPLPAEDVES